MTSKAKVKLVETAAPMHIPAFDIKPWQQQAWELIVRAKRNNRVHHALLISGLPGLGKLDFAYNLAHSLLCRTPNTNGSPCDNCHNCHLFRVGNHPDLCRIAEDPKSKRGEIKVESIRGILDFDELAAHAGGYKVIIIAPAEKMNRNAANALLKTLEEPSPTTTILLVSSRPDRLAATIRSRCQHLPLYIPKESEALAWLAAYGEQKCGERTRTHAPDRRCEGHPPPPHCGPDVALALRLARGAPLAAISFLDNALLQQRREAFEGFMELTNRRANPIAVAERWANMELLQVLTWMGSWVADLLRLQSGTVDVYVDNPDFIAPLHKCSSKYNPVVLHKLWSHILETRQKMQAVTANTQLLTESLLIRWEEIQS